MSSWSSERGCRPFSFSEIIKATDSFRNYVGRGGEGMVFKGVLKDGSHVAVKRLNPDLKEDDYEKEINMLSTLHHTNLVSLRGYCQKSDEKKILVYEFMSNGSLADNLYRKPAGFILSWEQRLNIAIGSARGLEYLHTGTSYAYKIIHRDVKPDNILLGLHWEAKVSDFGLSKIGPANQEHSSVITERARGTIGYYAPEYFSSGKITWRVDVFAFGVVLFELLCKKKPWGRDDSTLNEDGYKDEATLANWAERNVDPDLKGKISPSCLEAFIQIAEQCVSKDMEQRPSMNKVVADLNYALKLLKRDSENVQSAKFEKKSQTEIKILAKQESTVASIKVVHSTMTSSEEMIPGEETQASSSGAAIESGFLEQRPSMNEVVADLNYALKKETSTSLADIPGTEDKVVLYWSCTGVVADYMTMKFYLNRFSVDIEERDPTVNQEYELELSRFLAQKQKEFSLPQLFIGEKYIGGAKEVVQLFDSGELKTSLEGYQH